MASNPYKEDTLKDIEEMLLNDPTFKHDLVMGKYGYHPEDQAKRVNAEVQKMFEDLSS